MTEQLIELQEIQNQIKKKLKQAIAQIDEKKLGTVKTETFFQILQVLDVNLSQNDKK